MYKEIPGRLILGVLIHEVSTGKEWVLCKSCYCSEYKLDETSVQPDMLVEKHTSLMEGDNCSHCGKDFR